MAIERKFSILNVPKTGKKIKDLRLAAGYTVKEIQEYFNFDNPQAIYKWESGKCIPCPDNLVALADLYSVRVDDILTRDRGIDQSSGRKRLWNLNSDYRRHISENPFFCGSRLAA